MSLHSQEEGRQRRWNQRERLWLMYFGARRIIFEYLEKGQTITGQYYTSLLVPQMGEWEKTSLFEEKSSFRSGYCTSTYVRSAIG